MRQIRHQLETPQQVEAGIGEPVPPRPSDDVVRRVLGEFLTVPGLRVTEAQGRRLWGLDRVACRQLFGSLVEANILCRTCDGAFKRASQRR